MDRSDLARVPRPRSRADRPSAGPAGRHLPSRVPAALGGSAACDGDLAEPARAGRRCGDGPTARRQRRLAAAGCDRRDRRAHRRRAALRRGDDQGGARSRRRARPGGCRVGALDRAGCAGDVAGLADGAPRPARPGGKGGCPDRRRDRPRILLRAGSFGRRTR